MLRVRYIGGTTLVDNQFFPERRIWYKISAWDIHDNEGGYTLLSQEEMGGAVGSETLPLYQLARARPNPLRLRTMISFRLGAPFSADLSVMDVGGRRVRRLLHGSLDARSYEVVWDGTDDRGARVLPGTYFLKLQAGGWSGSQKISVVP